MSAHRDPAPGPSPDATPGTPTGDAHPSLLDRVISGALEPDYELVARRRAAAREADPGAAPDRSLRRRVTTAAVLAAFVVLVVAASLENREDEPADALVRETLVSTASERRADLERLRGDVADLRAGNTQLSAESAAAAQDRDRAVARLRRVGAGAGFQPVTGPGLLITLTDAPGGGELIRSDDLALLVDGLWEAGAEAIAVNGERLTSRSAITTTNVSININRRPLTAPYAVRAVGGPDVLETRLAETQGGVAWSLLVQEFGFGSETASRDQLELPAAPDLLLSTCDACFPEAETQGGQPPED